MKSPSETSPAKPEPSVNATLHPRELELLELLRDPRHQFGEVTVLMRAGLPYKIIRTVEHTLIDDAKR